VLVPDFLANKVQCILACISLLDKVVHVLYWYGLNEMRLQFGMWQQFEGGSFCKASCASWLSRRIFSTSSPLPFQKRTLASVLLFLGLQIDPRQMNGGSDAQEEGDGDHLAALGRPAAAVEKDAGVSVGLVIQLQCQKRAKMTKVS